MADTKKEKKIDRRTLYTKGVIKDAFLELVKKNPIEKITVTKICKMAEINRGTFYIHYIDIYDVLDDLLNEVAEVTSDIFSHLEIGEGENECINKCTYPLCRLLQEDNKYKHLFFNDSLNNYIINKMIEFKKDEYVKRIVEVCGVDEELAYPILVFQINGCLAVNKCMHRRGVKNWCQTQKIIDKFVEGGFKNLINSK